MICLFAAVPAAAAGDDVGGSAETRTISLSDHRNSQGGVTAILEKEGGGDDDGDGLPEQLVR